MAEVIHIRQQERRFCFEQVMGVWGKGTAFESACSTTSNVESGASGCLFWFAISFLAHRFAVQLDTISIVNDAIQNTVGDRWIANLFVPVRHGNCEVRINDRR